MWVARTAHLRLDWLQSWCSVAQVVHDSCGDSDRVTAAPALPPCDHPGGLSSPFPWSPRGGQGLGTRGDLGTGFPGPDVSGDTACTGHVLTPRLPHLWATGEPHSRQRKRTLLPSVCGGCRESTTAHTLLCHLHCPPSQPPGREPAGVSTHSTQAQHEDSGAHCGLRPCLSILVDNYFRMCHCTGNVPLDQSPGLPTLAP